MSILLFLGIGRQIAAIADSVTTTLEMLCYDIMNCLFYCNFRYESLLDFALTGKLSTLTLQKANDKLV